ncbi:PEP-CTERM sorting domain-containing protein [Blastopirellula marina]|uniref:Ice-binding protein C-terminal domain-containing protein n=1 Tax=Blastopirellula marina TaxID=124 RepID=A0A2S8GLU2_9BACT|nr:PEP-CTERM sorting domain-containing protein [Blastopirellula marina]PQO45398.1 hypothetical protein C5Y93_13175 [Blastopirellula marina]
MRTERGLISLLLLLAVTVQLDAGIVTVDPFTGTLQESFEDQPFDQGNLFDGDGAFSSSMPMEGFIQSVSNAGGGELGGTILAQEGDRFIYHVFSQGNSVFEFDGAIDHFGGYFNSLYQTGSGSTISFYNGATLVDTVNIDVGFGEWIWQGWTATDGDTFDRVSIDHNTVSLGPYNAIYMDNLQAGSIASVPEPSSMLLFGMSALGVGIVARRRQRSRLK